MPLCTANAVPFRRSLHGFAIRSIKLRFIFSQTCTVCLLSTQKKASVLPSFASALVPNRPATAQAIRSAIIMSSKPEPPWRSVLMMFSLITSNTCAWCGSLWIVCYRYLQCNRGSILWPTKIIHSSNSYMFLASVPCTLWSLFFLNGSCFYKT